MGKLCSFIQSPTNNHWNIVKHVLRYLKFSQRYKVYYKPERNQLKVYTDANFGTDLNSSKSITGICTLLFNFMVNCMSKRQPTVATSTTEAEINAVTEAFYDIVYINDLMNELEENIHLDKIVLNDNQSSLATIKSGGDFSRNRHYRTKINFTKDAISKENVSLRYIESELNAADVFTKPVLNQKLKKVLESLNIRE